MLRNRLYFRLKPFIPQPLRMTMRRWFVRRKLIHVGDVWPVLPGAERSPLGWSGWPKNQKFAFVLTHDVESQRGLDRVKRLAEIEESLGFRSSFNLIPEGTYSVPPELREWLVDHAFEVGVHDLHHDGKLYSSYAEFRKKAARIEKYATEWNAAGFRSGFMLNRLDWLHDLNVLYDASTFDTDPFEPQPDGVGTIFPFWVPRPSRSNPDGAEATDGPVRSGYAELPYTLPQDSTLFLLLGETSAVTWLRKLEWIAERGGMALMIVHPDYIQFDDEPASRHTFPIQIYVDFLRQVSLRYEGSYWHVLPREVAAFTAQRKTRVLPAAKRVCMLTYSHYQTDARVTRYAEALASRGDHVDVFALRRSANDPAAEDLGGVHLSCKQARIGKNEQSHLDYLLPVLRFLVSTMIRIMRQHIRRRYDVLHIHNMPDFLVFAAWYPKLTGAKVILDIHDIVPELYGSKFDAENGSRAVDILKWVERKSAHFADHVIISNHLWLEKFTCRTGSKGKCSVFINNVDSHTFRRRPRTRDDGRCILLFPGGLQWHQGLDIALRAFLRVSQTIPNAEFHIYGEGVMKASLIALAKELGFNGSVRFSSSLPVKQIAEVMADADLGIVPKRADSFGNEAYSTKIMEFMSLGVPVVVANTKVDQYYFDDSVVQFFESGNPDALAEASLAVLRDPVRRQEMIFNASAYAARNNWDSRKADYLQLVDSLC